MTDDTDKVTLAECLEYIDDEINSTGMGALAEDLQHDPGYQILLAILSHLRTLQGIEAGTHVVVPVERLRAMLGLIPHEVLADFKAKNSEPIPARPGAPE